MKGIITVLLLFSISTGLSGAPGAQEGSLDGAARTLRAEAIAAMTVGNYTSAIRLLKEFNGKYPGRFEENLYLGKCYMAAGMFEEAAAFLAEARTKFAGDYQFVEMLGQAYLELGEREKAVEVWHSILTGKEKDVARYLQVSRAEWNAGMFDQAIETLKEARRFERHYARFTAEIVRMEKTRGNFRGAFIESLSGFEMEEKPDLVRASGTIRAFRDAGAPVALIAVVDSFVSHGKQNAPFFETLRAALLVDIDDYRGASQYLLSDRSGRIPERDFYSYVIYLYSLGTKAGDPRFEGYLERASSQFISKYGDSPRTPRILLEAAQHAALSAGRGGAGERDYALLAILMADSTISNKRGRPYAEKAALLKARVYLEYLHDPASALRTIDTSKWRQAGMAREAQAIRLEALMLSGRWADALKRFESLAASPDSSLAASGKYGKGMVHFYRGEFEESAKLLSEVAAEAPWSKWANDALAVAVLIRRAESGNPEVLASFASAMTAGGSGRYGEAADSLIAVAGQYPEAVLAPEAFYESALLLEQAGRHDEAVALLERIAETYPLSRAAPRAVETLAGVLEDADPEASMRWYALFLDRYGEDPWVTRVRSRYIRLRKGMDNTAEVDET